MISLPQTICPSLSLAPFTRLCFLVNLSDLSHTRFRMFSPPFDSDLNKTWGSGPAFAKVTLTTLHARLTTKSVRSVLQVAFLQDSPIHADFNYSQQGSEGKSATLECTKMRWVTSQTVLSPFSSLVTLSSPPILGCPLLPSNPLVEFHSTSDQSPVARRQVRLQLQPLTTT